VIQQTGSWNNPKTFFECLTLLMMISLWSSTHNFSWYNVIAHLAPNTDFRRKLKLFFNLLHSIICSLCSWKPVASHFFSQTLVSLHLSGLSATTTLLSTRDALIFTSGYSKSFCGPLLVFCVAFCYFSLSMHVFWSWFHFWPHFCFFNRG